MTKSSRDANQFPYFLQFLAKPQGTSLSSLLTLLSSLLTSFSSPNQVFMSLKCLLQVCSILYLIEITLELGFLIFFRDRKISAAASDFSLERENETSWEQRLFALVENFNTTRHQGRTSPEKLFLMDASPTRYCIDT